MKCAGLRVMSLLAKKLLDWGAEKYLLVRRIPQKDAREYRDEAHKNT